MDLWYASTEVTGCRPALSAGEAYVEVPKHLECLSVFPTLLTGFMTPSLRIHRDIQFVKLVLIYCHPEYETMVTYWI